MKKLVNLSVEDLHMLALDGARAWLNEWLLRELSDSESAGVRERVAYWSAVVRELNALVLEAPIDYTYYRPNKK